MGKFCLTAIDALLRSGALFARKFHEQQAEQLLQRLAAHVAADDPHGRHGCGRHPERSTVILSAAPSS
jgi:hypothetical protein